MFKLLILAIFFIYLLIQSASDVKTKTVFVLLNDAAILLGGAITAISIYLNAIILNEITKETLLSIFIEIALFALLLALVTNGSRISIAKTYGSGDTRAMFAIYLAFHIFNIYDTMPTLSLFYTLLVMLISSLLFMAYMFVFKKDKKERRAFFPFITTAYTLVAFLGLVNF